MSEHASFPGNTTHFLNKPVLTTLETIHIEFKEAKPKMAPTKPAEPL